MRGRPRIRAWSYAVPVVALLAGVLFATSAEIAHGTDLRAGRRAQLTDLIAAKEREGQHYQRQIKRLRADIDAMSRDKAHDNSRLREARQHRSDLAAHAEFAPVTGSGLRITLDDAARPGGSGQMPGGPTPNDLVVHQQDIQAVVNALWAGGARGVQVMDQRMIGTSAIRCVGNTLILQGVVYSPPYTVTAVGDPTAMRAALRASPDVRIYKQYVHKYGLGYQVEHLDKVTLQAYDGVPGLDFAGVPSQ